MMNNSKVAQVASTLLLLLLVEVVNNVRALPRFESPCNHDGLEVLSNSFLAWGKNLTSGSFEPASVVATIFRSYDSDGDSALDQTELTNWVQVELEDLDSDVCITLLLESLDKDSDSVVNVDELKALIAEVSKWLRD